MDVVNSAFPSCISGTLDGGKVSLSCKSTYCQGDQRLRRLHLPAFSNRPLCVASVQGPFLLQSRTVASYPPHGRGGRPATRPRFRGYGRRSPWSDFPIQVAERPYVAAPSASPTRGTARPDQVRKVLTCGTGPAEHRSPGNASLVNSSDLPHVSAGH